MNNDWSLKDKLKNRTELDNPKYEQYDNSFHFIECYDKVDIETLRQKLIDDFVEMVADCSTIFHPMGISKIEYLKEWVNNKEDTEIIPFLYGGMPVKAYRDFINQINKRFGVQK